MKNVCLDPYFGDMIYNHGWEKEDSLFLFDKEWDIKIVAEAYSDEEISDIQRKKILKIYK